jgi:hypothetical protein
MALIQTENRAGKPIEVYDYKLIPIEKSSRIQPPGMWGVLRWYRPSAVVVRHPRSVDEVIEIEDPTRKAQLVLLGVGLVGSLILILFNKCSNNRRKQNV